LIDFNRVDAVRLPVACDTDHSVAAGDAVLRRVHVLVFLGAADLEEREEGTWERVERGVPGRDHRGEVVLCAL
jgi:hypothetical protein